MPKSILAVIFGARLCIHIYAVLIPSAQFRSTIYRMDEAYILSNCLIIFHLSIIDLSIYRVTDYLQLRFKSFSLVLVLLLSISNCCSAKLE